MPARTTSRRLATFVIAGLAVMSSLSCVLDFDQAVPCDNDGQCAADRVCDTVIRRCVKDGAQIRPPLPDVESGTDSDASTTPAPTDASDPGTPSGPECDPAVEDCEELCDGFFEDDDCVCDTRFTECVGGQCPQGMAFVERSGAEGEDLSFCIDAFEASRADATATDEGSSDEPLRSAPEVLPARGFGYDEAIAACEARSMRLCTMQEWRLACEGPDRSVFPYGNQIERSACNGLGFRVGTEEGPPETTIPTGSEPLCEASTGVFDLGGNLEEWVQERHLAGGNYTSTPSRLTCTSFVLTPSDPPEGEARDTIGLRCCRETY